MSDCTESLMQPLKTQIWERQSDYRQEKGLNLFYDRMYSNTKYLKIHTIYDLRTIRILLSLKSGVSENHHKYK